MAPLTSSAFFNPPSLNNDAPLSPFQPTYLLRRNRAPPTTPYKPGAGTFDPHSINNRGFFALFALIGVAFVVASIWFFFWAKNGGFVWRKNDWSDYKSTVLRRKGPNGTTLSGATKTTDLGGGSIVATDADQEWDEQGTIYSEKPTPRHKAKGGKKSKAPRGSRNNHDTDVRAYRHEKPARVGGLNREADGSYHHDFASSTSPSETAPHNYRRTTSNPFKASTTSSKKLPNPVTPQKKAGFYTHSPASNSSQRPLRPNAAQPGSGPSTPTRSRQSSPRKHNNPHHQRSAGYTAPIDFSRYSSSRANSEAGWRAESEAGWRAESEAGRTEDSRGTKAYFHPIPGLGAGAGSAGRGSYAGFRRGRGRRDSLSDSEEGGTVMS